MHLTVQLTSHSDPSRGETDRMAEVFPVQFAFGVEFKRNGAARDKFLREIADAIRGIAKAHNAKFAAEHPPVKT